MATFAHLEKQRAEVLAQIDGWSGARLCYRPRPGAWSTAEVLDHVVRVETLTLRSVQAGVLDPHPLRLRDKAGFVVMAQILRSNLRVKVPRSAPLVWPETDPDPRAVLLRWYRTRRRLESLLATPQAGAIACGVFRHPFAGWMSLPQVLDYFSLHLLHHRFQLGRLAQCSREP